MRAFGTQIVLVVEDGNQNIWLAGVTAEINNYVRLVNRNIIVFGEYMGIAGAFDDHPILMLLRYEVGGELFFAPSAELEELGTTLAEVRESLTFAERHQSSTQPHAAQRQYSVGDLIVFESGTEIRVISIQETHVYNADVGTHDLRTLRPGYKAIVVTYEVLTPMQPHSGRYVEPFFVSAVIADDGTAFRGIWIPRRSLVSPNVRSTIDVIVRVPNAEVITAVEIFDADSAIGHTARVSLQA